MFCGKEIRKLKLCKIYARRRGGRGRCARITMWREGRGNSSRSHYARLHQMERREGEEENVTEIQTDG